MARQVGVGIIGASANGMSWAAKTHVPAIASITGMRIAGVATSNWRSAQRAGEAFNARPYEDTTTLIHAPDVEVVAICVRVPDHFPMVSEALAAGKHVFCEWPLARSAQDAEVLVSAAEAAGRRIVVGLQGRGSPSAQRARALLSEGVIGRPLHVRIFSSTAGFGDVQPATYAYLSDESSGATLTSINGGHTLDICQYLMGSISTIAAIGTVNFPTFTIAESGESVRRTASDHLLAQGRFASTVPYTLEVARKPETKSEFKLEVVGTDGSLTLAGGHPVGFQAGPMRVVLNDRVVAEDDVVAGVDPAVANARAIWVQLERDVRTGTSIAPDGEVALRLTHLLDAVRRSASTACAVNVTSTT